MEPRLRAHMITRERQSWEKMMNCDGKSQIYEMLRTRVVSPKSEAVIKCGFSRERARRLASLGTKRSYRAVGISLYITRDV